jgi:beta-phosphoglucomutase-like phosphatase (HAD superfamily)
MSSLSFQAVVFDLDGLVLDSESTYFAAWQQAAALMGYEQDAGFCATLSGLHGAAVYQRLREHYGVNFNEVLFKRLSRECWLEALSHQGMPIKSGFFELLKVIEDQKYAFCVATNSARADAEYCLKAAGLKDVFDLVMTRDDVLRGKPSPAIYHTAAARLGLTSEDCLVLEDSPVGVAAAYAAEAPCIMVPSQYPVDPLAASQAYRVFKDLLQVADFVSAA